MNKQISLFDFDAIFSAMANSMADDKHERSNKQKNKKVAYDCGEKIYGSRKDLAAQRQSFISKPSVEVLREIEEADSNLADELVTKSLFFDWYSLEWARDNGLEVSAAKGLQLAIRRLPKDSKGLDRICYFKAMEFISNEFKNVKTYNELYACIQRLAFTYNMHTYKYRTVNRIKHLEDKLTMETDDENIQAISSQLQLWTGHYYVGEMNNHYHLEILGSFTELLNSVKKRVKFYDGISYLSKWDEVIKPKETKGTKSRERAWTRELPETPERFAQEDVKLLEKPEQFQEFFGFRSIEFGNYVDDEKAFEHLSNASYAFQDLATILNIPIEGVSLDGTLAMAFGSRGRGNALAHYERNYRVINLTKERGVLGALAHEWFHSFDHFLFNYLVEKEQMVFLTEAPTNKAIPTDVQEKLVKLIKVMMEGNCVAYKDVSECKNHYRFARHFKEVYEAAEGDLYTCMSVLLREEDERIERTLNRYIDSSAREKRAKTLATTRKRHLREYAEALSQYHFEKTMNKITNIPYPSNESQYLLNSIECDKGHRGKYWSSVLEMAARAFESFIYDELKSRGWKNDYLVCGINGSTIYPAGDERNSINTAMREFLEVALPALKK